MQTNPNETLPQGTGKPIICNREFALVVYATYFYHLLVVQNWGQNWFALVIKYHLIPITSFAPMDEFLPGPSRRHSHCTVPTAHYAKNFLHHLATHLSCTGQSMIHKVVGREFCCRASSRRVLGIPERSGDGV